MTHQNQPALLLGAEGVCHQGLVDRFPGYVNRPGPVSLGALALLHEGGDGGQVAQSRAVVDAVPGVAHAGVGGEAEGLFATHLIADQAEGGAELCQHNHAGFLSLLSGEGPFHLVQGVAQSADVDFALPGEEVEGVGLVFQPL